MPSQHSRSHRRSLGHDRSSREATPGRTSRGLTQANTGGVSITCISKTSKIVNLLLDKSRLVPYHHGLGSDWGRAEFSRRNGRKPTLPPWSWDELSSVASLVLQRPFRPLTSRQGAFRRTTANPSNGLGRGSTLDRAVTRSVAEATSSA